MIQLGNASGLFFLLIRGLVLWILVPFAIVAWIFVHWWAQRVSIGQAICWYDQNFLVILILVPFRYLMHRNPELRAAKFIPLSGMPTTKTYKMFPTDFV